MGKARKEIKKACMLALFLLLLCGLLYPLFITAIAQVAFPKQANGSLIVANNQPVGSELIGQEFTDPRFMRSRVSAVRYNTYTKEMTNNGEYTAVASGSDNLAPSNPALLNRINADITEFLRINPTAKQENIPADLITASGSGLDPHISPEAANIQIAALVKTTGLTEERLQNIVKENTEGRLLGIFGEEKVNVLKVNLQIAKDLKVISPL